MSWFYSGVASSPSSGIRGNIGARLMRAKAKHTKPICAGNDGKCAGLAPFGGKYVSLKVHKMKIGKQQMAGTVTTIVLHSHWSRSNDAQLSLVESFRVEKYFHNIAPAEGGFGCPSWSSGPWCTLNLRQNLVNLVILKRFAIKNQ